MNRDKSLRIDMAGGDKRNKGTRPNQREPAQAEGMRALKRQKDTEGGFAGIGVEKKVP